MQQPNRENIVKISKNFTVQKILYGGSVQTYTHHTFNLPIHLLFLMFEEMVWWVSNCLCHFVIYRWLLSEIINIEITKKNHTKSEKPSNLFLCRLLRHKKCYTYHQQMPESCSYWDQKKFKEVSLSLNASSQLIYPVSFV